LLALLFGTSALVRADDCSRFVSLAPSITETLFALDLGPQVKAVTRFCRFPIEAQKLPKVGGFLDLSLEAIVAHRPTVVFLLTEQGDARVNLERFGAKTVTIDHSKVSGILDSLNTIGVMCGRTPQAGDLRSEMEARINEVKKQVAGKTVVRTLVTVGRGQETDSMSGVFASGSDGFYNELIEIAGGININRSSTISFPTLSAEGVTRANPEVILEIVDPTDAEKVSREKILNSWAAFPRVDAVKQGRIYLFTEDFASIPGPRFVEVLGKFAELLHPGDSP
jgi:iron complex transport system substrate-binding protein